ncbi:hypothetical protein FOCC_FOCC011154 [Frankliniella occidentalis]|nr:hypothetical protein FOCC_FOCC011154 [Frankliniella occidentalis]
MSRGYSFAAQGPVFLLEPPALVQFLNSTGAVVECSAAGQPPPRITWIDQSGHEVLHVPGLRTQGAHTDVIGAIRKASLGTGGRGFFLREIIAHQELLTDINNQ